MGYFFIALIAFALGFVIGLRSKAQAKINKREATKQGNIYVKDRDNTPKYRSTPPPPPPRTLREGSSPQKPKSMQKNIDHVKPGIMYKKNTFVKVNQRTNCKAIGHEYNMFRTNPCPKCGGDVKRCGAAKWVDKEWVISKV